MKLYKTVFYILVVKFSYTKISESPTILLFTFAGGKKHFIQISINGTPAQINLDVDTRELVITSYNILASYKIKEALRRRLRIFKRKEILEDVRISLMVTFNFPLVFFKAVIYTIFTYSFKISKLYLISH